MAYQTSCASYTSGRVGLTSATAVVADAAGREQTQHGSPLFPIACYAEDLSCFSVAWHWHEELEVLVVSEGMIFAADTADGGCSIAFYGDDTPVGSRIH